MKKEKDFKVNLISVQRASNKNMDSKYHVLGEVKKVRKKRTNGTEYAEDTTVKKRERKKRVTVDISNLHNDSLDENKEAKGFEVIPSKRRGRKPKKLMANEVLIEDVLKGASSEEKLSVAQQQPLLKENQIKDDFIGFLNRRTEEIKSVFSEIKDYISTLLKVIDDKDKELIEVKARLETEITTVSNTIKEAQKTQENLSVIQEKLDQKNIQIKRLESEIEKLKSKGSKKVNLVKKTKAPPPIKNMAINEDGSKDFNFGVRKPVTNCEELLSGNAWEKYLINKWVHEYNPTEGKDVFYKHILQNSRVIQIVYSGLDILGDGVYVLYKARLYEKNEDFYVDPQEFNLLIGSFECEDFLEELVKRDLITIEEKDILFTHTKREKFKENLPFMNEKILPNK